MRNNIPKSRISQQALKHWVAISLQNDTLPIVPVVVIKGKHQCIEWKRFVEIVDDDGCTQYVGISLKFMKEISNGKLSAWTMMLVVYSINID